MADLIVTAAAVEEGAKQLKTIQDAFENANKKRDEYRDVWGHQVVRQAMHDFVEDWWPKREKLLANVKDFQSKMQKSAETWGSTEDELVNSMTPKGGPDA